MTVRQTRIAFISSQYLPRAVPPLQPPAADRRRRVRKTHTERLRHAHTAVDRRTANAGDIGNAVLSSAWRIAPVPKLEASNGLRFQARPASGRLLPSQYRRFPVAGNAIKSIHFFAHRPADFKLHDVTVRRGDHRLHRPSPPSAVGKQI